MTNTPAPGTTTGHQVSDHLPPLPVATLAMLAIGPIAVAIPGESLATVRAVALIGYCLTCPGVVLTPRLRVVDTTTRVTLVITTSLAVTAVCSELLAIARVWSAPALVGLLSLIGLAGVWLERRLETAS